MTAPSPIPSTLLEPDPPFDEDELLASLTVLFDEATRPGEPTPIEGLDERFAARTEANDKVERWQITGLRSLEWAMSKYGEYAATHGTNAAQAEEWRAIIYASVAEHLERIDAWEAEVNRPIAQKMEFFEGHLIRYALANRTERTKTFKVPSGSVPTSASAATFEIPKDGQAAAVEYARAHGLPVKEETTITALKATTTFVEVAARIPVADGWEWLAPDAIAIEWVPDPRPDDADEFWEESGTWRVTNKANGEVITDADVWEGPFVVDADTGEPLTFLTPKPSVVTAKVVLS